MATVIEFRNHIIALNLHLIYAWMIVGFIVIACDWFNRKKSIFKYPCPSVLSGSTVSGNAVNFFLFN